VNKNDFKIINGDSLEVLKTIVSNSIDSLVTDPPAGISFMGKDWDSNKGGSKEWIAWLTEISKEILRVLKPGAHGFVWAIPRTSHWTATALEQAGFEIRDVVTHLFGSGFPKSLNIGKAIDKAAGVEREVVGLKKKTPSYSSDKTNTNSEEWNYGNSNQTYEQSITAPATSEAKQWDGWGTGLKPSSEHWILIRKPISEKTIASNVLKHGTGGINIDGSRIGFQSERDKHDSRPTHSNDKGNRYSLIGRTTKGHKVKENPHQGRFPANTVLSGDVPQMLDEQSGVLKKGGYQRGSKLNRSGTLPGQLYGKYNPSSADSRTDIHKGDYGASRFFKCFKDTNMDHGEKGLRFKYCAKPSKREKNQGCEGMVPIDVYHDPETTSGVGGLHINSNPRCLKCRKEKFHRVGVGKCDCIEPEWKLAKTKPSQNNHPTVKSIKLMKYLINMITPPGGIVLDPFMGSGTTGLACKDKFSFIGIEKEQEYIDIAKARVGL